ncbi:MAG: DMT family transporter [Pseudomonadota bacterium]
MPLQGIFLKLLSVLAFTAMVTLIKLLGDRVPVGQVVFARAFFGLLPLIALITWERSWNSAIATRRPLGHMGRALVGLAAMSMWFAALSRLPLPDATAISFAAPLITTALAVVLLGEVVRLYRWSAILVGFLGVLIILSPNLGLVGALEDPVRQTGALLALASAACMALAQIFVRKLVKTETTTATVFYFSACASVFSLFTLPFGWVMPDATTLLMLLAIGLLGGIGQILITQAFRFADASVVAPFDYTAMIFALVIGYLLFDEVPGVAVLAGSVLVVGAGLFVIYREHQIGIARRAAGGARTPS